MRKLALAGLLLVGGCNFQSIPPVGPSVCAPPQLEEITARAVAYWNAAGTQLDAPSCPAQTAITIVPSIDGMRGLTGRTLQHSDGPPEIFVAENALDGGDVELRTVAHELGHALGFFHVGDRASAMWPAAAETPLPATPGPTDVDLVRSLF